MTDNPAVVTQAAARTKEIVVVAGGHWGRAASSKIPRVNALNDRTQFPLYSNWQEVAIHAGDKLTRPNAATEVYSGGIYYTVMRSTRSRSR